VQPLVCPACGRTSYSASRGGTCPYCGHKFQEGEDQKSKKPIFRLSLGSFEFGLEDFPPNLVGQTMVDIAFCQIEQDKDNQYGPDCDWR